MPSSAALVAYQMLRATRARRVVEAAFRMGQIGQWKNPLARALRNLAVSLIPEARMIASLDWLYDFTP